VYYLVFYTLGCIINLVVIRFESIWHALICYWLTFPLNLYQEALVSSSLVVKLEASGILCTTQKIPAGNNFKRFFFTSFCVPEERETDGGDVGQGAYTEKQGVASCWRWQWKGTVPFNPATQVLSGERSLQDAISYLDTVILGLFQLEFLPCYNTLLYYHCYWFIYWKINVVPVIKLIHPQIHVSLNGWLLKYKHDATVI